MRSFYSDAPLMVQAALRLLQITPDPLTPRDVGALLWEADRLKWAEAGEGHFPGTWVLGAAGPAVAGMELLDRQELPTGWLSWLRPTTESWWPGQGLRATERGRDGELGELTPCLERHLRAALLVGKPVLHERRRAMGVAWVQEGLTVGTAVSVEGMLRCQGWDEPAVVEHSREHHERTSARHLRERGR